MSIAFAVVVIVGAAIGAVLIPPRRFFGTKRARAQVPPDPMVSAVDEEPR